MHNYINHFEPPRESIKCLIERQTFLLAKKYFIAFHIDMINSVKYNQQSFQARNSEIRDVDKICRQVRLMFPVISPTKLNSFKNHDYFLDFIYKKDDILNQIRAIQGQAPNIKDFFDILFNLMKKEKVGNCGELSLATLIGLKLKGYKNCYRANLYAYNQKTQKYRDIDHQVVILLNKPFSQLNLSEGENTGRFVRKRIIVDPFIGKTDYFFNMKREYVENNLFEAGIRDNEVLACNIEDIDICKEDLKKLEKYFTLGESSRNKTNSKQSKTQRFTNYLKRLINKLTVHNISEK